MVAFGAALFAAGCDWAQRGTSSGEGYSDGEQVCEPTSLEHSQAAGEFTCDDGVPVAESAFTGFAPVDFQAFFHVRVWADVHEGELFHTITLDVLDWACDLQEYNCSEYLDTLDGIDDCELKRFVNGGCCGYGGGWDGYDATSVDYIAGDQSGPMPTRFPGDDGPGAEFEVELDAPAYGQSYGFDAHGPEGTAMSFTALLTLPKQPELTSPALPPGTQLKGNTLALEWTGSGQEPLYIHLRAYDTLPHADYSTAYELHCEVEDDGAFEIPEALMQQIPGDQFVMLELERVDHTLEDVEGVDVVDTIAAHASVRTVYSQLTR